MASPIGPSTSMVQAGLFGSARYLPARSRLCCDSSARSRWRRFHFYWARLLAASVGLQWEKFPVGNRNRFLPRRRCSTGILPVGQAGIPCHSNPTGETPLGPTATMVVLRKNHALYMRVNVERRRAQKTYERLVAVARELDRKT